MLTAEHVWASKDRRTVPTCALCGAPHPNPYMVPVPFAAALGTVGDWHCPARAAFRQKLAVMARRRA